MKLTNVYQPKYKNGKSAQGFGDYIRGSVYVLQTAMQMGVGFDMNYAAHAVSKYLKHSFVDASLRAGTLAQQKLNIDSIEKDIDLVLETQGMSHTSFIKHVKQQNGIVATNKFPLYAITPFQRKIIQSKLQPTEELQTAIDDTMRNLNIVPKQYNIYHIRTGDKFLVKGAKLTPQLVMRLEQLLRTIVNPSQTNVLVSDNAALKKILQTKFPRIRMLHNEIVHLGEGAVCDNSTKNTLVEFFLIANAANVIGMSPYGHKTGFSEQCASVFDVPYYFIHIDTGELDTRSVMGLHF